ncbi:ABC transporter permease subunit [Rhizobium rosettiformans]|uniref:ABC transporter permease subunit n=1 Tax=Rhizobium rosettiformans TaxID=1368430 RepID=UPI00285B9651|nr:hypothetical protein [Rhizobium rosettiformans]MDR7030865.1 ABC-type xylose transport system permease subunit [Rhizobium rosettiformans]MDR7066849.1 ABC-type xylose transport system permease subunit [Rhizobium rosettiformans]
MMIGVAVAALIGFFNSLCITKLKMMSLIQIMFLMVILQGSLLALTQAKTLTNLSDGCALFGQVTIEGWPIMPLTMLAALILIGVVLQMTALGCSIYAVSGNPLASNSAGISVDRIQIIHLYDCLLHRRRRRLPPRLPADRHHLQPGLEPYVTSLRFLPGASGSTGACIYAARSTSS